MNTEQSSLLEPSRVTHSRGLAPAAAPANTRLCETVVSLALALAATTLLGIGIAACGAGDASSTGALPNSDGKGSTDGLDGADGVDGTSGTTGTDATDGFIPEDEQNLDLQAPQGGDRFVFVVSTTLDAVVRIDGVSLDVELIEVGGEPTVMRTLGTEDALVVFNRGTRDFSVVRFDDGGQSEVTTLDAGALVNRLEVSPSGRYAVAFFDVAAASVTEPLGDLQLALVLDLAPGVNSVTPVGVGFAPESVVFTQNEAELLMVTESGISIIDLAGLGEPQFAPSVPLGPIPADAPDREVLLTADGSHAIVRVGGETDVRVVPLDGSAAWTVSLTSSPTDIDIMPDDQTLLAVLRDDLQLALWPLSDPDAADPESGVVTLLDLPDTPAGTATVNASAGEVLLHTTLPGNEWLAVLDLETQAIVRHDLKKGVAAVAPSPDGNRVVILHDRLEETVLPTDDLELRIDKSWAYSVLDVASGFVKLVLLESKPRRFLVTPDSLHAYVLIPDQTNAGYHAVDEVDLASLLVTTHPLGSPPEHLIEVPDADRIAVSQEHPVGRITFLSTAGAPTETVTGFELNGLIE